MNKPNIVTRFLKDEAIIDKKYIDPSGFIRPKDRKLGEISVFNIDKQLKDKDDEAIFKIADKKLPGITARADMQVSKIEEIQYDKEEYLKLCDYENPDGHCNIKPIPSDKEKALNIATELTFIAKLLIR